jgi:hypothetical protein
MTLPVNLGLDEGGDGGELHGDVKGAEIGTLGRTLGEIGEALLTVQFSTTSPKVSQRIRSYP